MNRVLLIPIILLMLLSTDLKAQGLIDTLTYQRNIFNTAVYLNGYRQSGDQLNFIYTESNSKEAKSLFSKSKKMRITGGLIAAGGLSLSVHALIGEKRSAIINDKEYIYYKRPIFQLLGGLGLITTGISIIEFGNDHKIKSVKSHNNNIIRIKKELEITSAGSLQLKLTF